MRLPHPAFPGADWGDCFEIVVMNGVTDAEAAARSAFERMPWWVGPLMAIRNLAVLPFGLKGDPDAAADDRERIGMFPVVSRQPSQVVLGFDDRHLDFRIVVESDRLTDERTSVRVMTLVKRHNRLGRFYLAAIMPFHKLIVASTMTRIG